MRTDNFLTLAAYKELDKHISHLDSLQNIKDYLQLKAVHLKGHHYLFYSFKMLPGILQTQTIVTILRKIEAKLDLTLSSLPEPNSRMTVSDKKLLSVFGYLWGLLIYEISSGWVVREVENLNVYNELMYWYQNNQDSF